jgi:hypothetical protein
MTLDEIMLAGVAAMEQMVADNTALNRAHRQGRYDEELKRIRERVLNGDRDDTGTPDATAANAGGV